MSFVVASMCVHFFLASISGTLFRVSVFSCVCV